ncbi:P-loop containing nucleoside triphosphate hydrolase protein [Xylaria sp. FL1777]|nr:P-loop containing nucleoside triphosphate hydrolase protein [Xylaria sp. FL1777]
MAQPFHVAGAAAGPLLGGNRAGISLIRDISEKALRFIDSTRAEHALAVLNLVNLVVPSLIDLFYSLRHYTRVFFTSAVTITAGDELYLQVLNWLAKRESQSRFVKEYTAQTLSDPRVASPLSKRKASHLARLKMPKLEEPSYIKLTPTFRTTWFFYRWNLLAILRNDKHSSEKNSVPFFGCFGPVAAPKERESLTITCLGWSTAPIQALLKSCRDMADAQRQTSVTIRGCRSGHWELMATKPVRPLDTITIEENVKENLISDLKMYLNPQRRQFYSEHGIPYRRGYLLHGPPGCGKSSLSLALAGFFGFDLYVVNLASIYEYELASLFAMLPARCFVLLEDIDAVDFRQDDDNGGPNGPGRSRQQCSLSSLLNVLDGVASQEGRVVIMTSNFPDRLDDALVRPGRIDVKVYMGHITRQGAQQIFLRMMKTGRLDKAGAGFPKAFDHVGEGWMVSRGLTEHKKVGEHEIDEELQVLAQKFAQHIPEKEFTPAQLQGYLLRYLHSATTAVDRIADWVADEKRRLDREALRKEEQLDKAQKRKDERIGIDAANKEFVDTPMSAPEFISLPPSSSPDTALASLKTADGAQMGFVEILK